MHIYANYKLSTNKGGSHEDDVAAQTGRVDLPGVLRCLQHPDVVQLLAGHVQILRPEGQDSVYKQCSAGWSGAYAK